MKGLPLNVMYWVDHGAQYENDPDEPRYEVLDGLFSMNDKYFYNLPRIACRMLVLCRQN